ncbi:MAG: hypothetical protein HY540_05115 [Deltaproteobacteria bacterium]|nr:hypothetical protein [Deltaproteobacteria bacterium]
MIAIPGQVAYLATAAVHSPLATTPPSLPNYDLGLSVKKNNLIFWGQPLQLLGHGHFGRVFVHPEDQGIILKLEALSAEAMLLGNSNHQKAWRDETDISSKLSETNLGPRYFGNFNIGGRFVTVKERIFGFTIEQLMWQKKFDRVAYHMVRSVLACAAMESVYLEDLRLCNLMIGTTQTHPQPRAFIIDGKNLQSTSPGIEGSFERDLIYQRIFMGSRFHPDLGHFDITKPLDDLLLEGVKESERPSLMQRFWSLFQKPVPVKSNLV